jgi:hypothetical protein
MHRTPRLSIASVTLVALALGTSAAALFTCSSPGPGYANIVPCVAGQVLPCLCSCWDAGSGDCSPGTQTCNEAGTDYGVCTGCMPVELGPRVQCLVGGLVADAGVTFACGQAGVTIIWSGGGACTEATAATTSCTAGTQCNVTSTSYDAGLMLGTCE